MSGRASQGFREIKIPLLDLKAQYRRIGAEVRRAIEEVLDSQRFILGSVVEEFEDEAASYLECVSAVGVASGSDALLLSLMALGVGPGDRVVVPAFTFFSTASAATRLGATPVFVDVDAEACLIDPKEVERVLEERPAKAVLPVHLFGRSCPMAELMALAKKYRLHIVEDAAQAFGAQVRLSPQVSKAAGTVGDAGCFSFFPTKTLGGIGDGGLVASDNGELGKKIRMLRVHGQNSKYHHELVGLNSRLDAIQAAVLRVKLRYIDQWCRERIERAKLYNDLFAATGLVGSEVISLPPVSENRSHVFNYYVIQVRRRDELREYLGQNGIQTEVYYPLPLHLQPCFSFLGYRKGDFPRAELASSRVVALPMYPELAPTEQEFVVEKVRAFYRR